MPPETENENENTETPPVEEPQNLERKEDSNDIEGLKSKIESLESRLDNQSRIIGKYENAAKKEVKEVPQEKKEELIRPPEEMKYTELEAKIAALEAKNNAKVEAIKRAKLAKYIVENGGEVETSADFADYLAYKNGSKINAVENDTGDISISVNVGDGEPVDAQSWVKMFMSSDAGKFMNASKRGPSVNNMGSSDSRREAAELSPMEFSKAMSKIAGDKTLTPDQKDSARKAFKMKDN